MNTKPKITDADIETMKELRSQGLTLSEIGAKYGVSGDYCSRLMKHGRRSNYIPCETPPVLSDYDKRRIYRLYWNYGYNAEEIAEMYGLYEDLIRKVLKAMPAPKSEDAS